MKSGGSKGIGVIVVNYILDCVPLKGEEREK